jgi:hypothetical protein
LTIDLQENPERARWFYLMMPAFNFTHKILLAILFGSLGLVLVSPMQLSLLILLQVRGFFLANARTREGCTCRSDSDEQGVTAKGADLMVFGLWDREI